jgi:hypothetical protein
MLGARIFAKHFVYRKLRLSAIKGRFIENFSTPIGQLPDNAT